MNTNDEECLDLSNKNPFSGIEKALNLNISEQEILPPSKIKDISNEEEYDDVNRDFQEARTNIKTIISKGEDALDGILDLAKASEHPRTFEVAGQIIKTLVDANKDLLGLHKQAKELKKNDEKSESAKTVNNTAYFVGTAAELQQMVNKRKGEDNV